MAEPISKSQMACDEATARARIADNWNAVRAAVSESAVSAGRPADCVRVVGVTKYVDAEITRWLVEAGCVDLGENRPQLLESKSQALDGLPIQWHQIGNLQRNKVRRLLPSQPLVHAISGRKLLDEIHAEAIKQERTIDGLIEINVSDEDAKTGLPPQELESLLTHALSLESPGSDSGSGLRIIGLMAMAGWGTDQDSAAKQFAMLRGLRDQMQTLTGAVLSELSMGMSGDYPAAIAEGATMVRIGTRLFEGVLLS